MPRKRIIGLDEEEKRMTRMALLHPSYVPDAELDRRVMDRILEDKIRLSESEYEWAMVTRAERYAALKRQERTKCISV